LRLVFKSYGTPVDQAYRAADVYVHHSRIGETYGNTLVEAATSGCLVVCALDLDWDCAPLETLGSDVHIIRSRRDLLRSPPDLFRQLPRVSRASSPPTETALAFAQRLASCANPSAIEWVPAPTLREAVNVLRREQHALGASSFNLTGALAREAARSLARKVGW
jgi:hypothetical protein